MSVFHRVSHVAPPSFYRSLEWTNQSLTLGRAFCVFCLLAADKGSPTHLYGEGEARCIQLVAICNSPRVGATKPHQSFQQHVWTQWTLFISRASQEKVCFHHLFILIIVICCVWVHQRCVATRPTVYCRVSRFVTRVKPLRRHCALYSCNTWTYMLWLGVCVSQNKSGINANLTKTWTVKLCETKCNNISVYIVTGFKWPPFLKSSGRHTGRMIWLTLTQKPVSLIWSRH